MIIPAYRAGATLPVVLSGLRAQIGPGTEVLVVESSGDGAAARLEREQPWLRVIELRERALPRGGP